MAKRIPPEVLEYLRSMGKAYGKLGGMTAAKNMTAEERKARAKKASMAAAKKRTAERLATRASERSGKSSRSESRGRTPTVRNKPDR
jgi:7-keto-8-aminopelargonate synthetase-like enzyme